MNPELEDCRCYTPTMERHKLIPAVYVMMLRDFRVLLMRRRNTGYMDGWYTLPSGHVQDGEKLTDAAAREVKEELGVVIDPLNLRFQHVMRRFEPGNDRVDFFYETRVWTRRPMNQEPDKCDEIIWTDIEHLPENTVPYVNDFLYYLYPKSVPNSELGWGKTRIPKRITEITWL